MSIFVYEYLSCQPPGTLAESLRAEGWAMLSAVVQDFAAISGVEVVSLLAEGSPHSLPAKVRHVNPATERAAFLELAGAAEFTLVIAPEFDELLLRRCRWVQDSGGKLLNPSPGVVERVADKLHLKRCLGAGLPTIPSDRFPKPKQTWLGQSELVVKPRFGAGALATFITRSHSEALRQLHEIRAAGFRGEMIMQRYLPGRPGSVLGVVGPRQTLLFPPAAQIIGQDGTLRYLGGEVPLDADFAPQAARLAGRVAAAVEGLTGIFGVDLLIDPGVNAHDGWIVEVNPRLTTSYVGLRALARFNVAEAMLAVVRGEPLPPLRWRSGHVVFGPDGSVRPG